MPISQPKILLEITKKVKKILRDSSLEAYIFLLSAKYLINFSCVPVDAFYLFSVTNFLNQIELKKPAKKSRRSSHLITQPKVFPYSDKLSKVCKPKKYSIKPNDKTFIYLFLSEKYLPFHFYSISAKTSPIPLTFFTDIIRQSKLENHHTTSIPLTLRFLTTEQRKNEEIEIE